MMSIVVVAENEQVAQARCELVRSVLFEGCPPPVQVLPACSVDDVLDILVKGRIDVLITDERLRGLTGAGLVRWLERLLTGTTTILLTSDPRILAEPWRFAVPEFNEVLAKPLQRDAVKASLHLWLGLSTTLAATAVPSITG